MAVRRRCPHAAHHAISFSKKKPERMPLTLRIPVISLRRRSEAASLLTLFQLFRLQRYKIFRYFAKTNKIKTVCLKEMTDIVADNDANDRI